MKARTVHQPWASLIACGAKHFETRGFPPPAHYIGSRIAIHASKIDPERAIDGLALHGEWETIQALVRAIHEAGLRLGDLPTGAVVCTAVLDGAYRIGSLYGEIAETRGEPLTARLLGIDDGVDPDAPLRFLPMDLFGDYAEGRWAWLLRDVVRFDPPVPAVGRQGWWTWWERGR